MEMINGLMVHTIKSEISNFNDPGQLDSNSLMSFIKSKFNQEGLCLCYLDYKVLIGKYTGESLQFYNNENIEPRFIQKLRLFNKNQDQELYIWRKNRKGFGARLRIDGRGDEVDVVDAKQVLWGTDSKACGDYTEIFEKRGTRLMLPFNKLTINNNEDRVFILTRNYISYDTCDGAYKQAGYTDCRFVAFTDKNGVQLEMR